MNSTSSAALVRRVLSGDIQAYEKLFLQTKDAIFFHARLILKSEEAAWDAVQDAYVAAFRSLEKLKSPDTVETWLCAIACNICFNRLRRLRGASAPADKASGAITPPARGAALGDISRFVEGRLMSLPDMPRTALLLRYCDDMSLAQIASIMRCGEDTVRASLDAAEKELCLCRDTASLAPGVTPTELKRALDAMCASASLSPAITLSIGTALAQRCGYASSLRVVSAREGEAAPARRDEAAPDTADMDAPAAPDSARRPPASDKAGKRRSSPAQGGKNPAMVLAAGLIVIGLVIGALTLRALMAANSSEVVIDGGLDAPEGASVQAVTPSPEDAAQALSSDSAQAYMSLMSDYVGRFGVCPAQADAAGLAYAALVDFDADGQEELYLYYIDSIGADASGKGVYRLTEELWRWNGALEKCASESYLSADYGEEAAANAGRWLYDDGGQYRLASWYTAVDENGYVNQYLNIYALEDGVLTLDTEVSAMFVVANAANQRRDGYLIESYYGTENSHFDDIGYFVEGAVVNADGRAAYNYEQCQAMVDLGTADIVPMTEGEQDTPVALLKRFYDIRRHRAQQLIYPAGLDGASTLTWATSDINSFLSLLAERCTGG